MIARSNGSNRRDVDEGPSQPAAILLQNKFPKPAHVSKVYICLILERNQRSSAPEKAISISQSLQRSLYPSSTFEHSKPETYPGGDRQHRRKVPSFLISGNTTSSLSHSAFSIHIDCLIFLQSIAPSALDTVPPLSRHCRHRASVSSGSITWLFVSS